MKKTNNDITFDINTEIEPQYFAVQELDKKIISRKY